MRGEQYPGAGYVHKRRFDRAVAENPISEGSATKSDVAASRAGALPFRKSNFIGNYNSQQRGTKMAVSAFQLLGNTLSVAQRFKTRPPLNCGVCEPRGLSNLRMNGVKGRRPLENQVFSGEKCSKTHL